MYTGQVDPHKKKKKKNQFWSISQTAHWISRVWSGTEVFNVLIAGRLLIQRTFTVKIKDPKSHYSLKDIEREK